ncbi:MAG: hypothetical protein AAFZ91_12365 [Pseudomonadota bacterium]
MKALIQPAILVALAISVSTAAHAEDTSYSEADVRIIYAGACGAHGMDAPKCACVVDGLLAEHSVEAIMANGLGMVLRDDEAVALTDQVGEPAVWAASDAFDLLQNTTCSDASMIAAAEEADAAVTGAIAGAEATASAAEESTTD